MKKKLIILTTDNKLLKRKKHDILEVSYVYANKLIKDGLAVDHDLENISKINRLKLDNLRKEKIEEKNVQNTFITLNNLNLEFYLNTSKEKVYGSVGPSDVLKKINELDKNFSFTRNNLINFKNFDKIGTFTFYLKIKGEKFARINALIKNKDLKQ